MVVRTDNFNNNEISSLLDTTLKHLKDNRWERAVENLNRVHSNHFNNKEVLATLKMFSFWSIRFQNSDLVITGDYLYDEWNNFLEYIKREIVDAPKVVFQSLKQYIFQRVLNCYGDEWEQKPAQKNRYLVRIGKTLKILGHFDQALLYFEDALKQEPTSVEVMIQLADCLGIMNELESSKVLFRESFFINPELVDPDSIDSAYMLELISRVKKRLERKDHLRLWIPVYAVVWGVFDIRRDLKPNEAEILKKRIYILKNELDVKRDKHSEIIPKLIYLYFMLIDYMKQKKMLRNAIDEIVNEIKLLDLSIYSLYTS